MFKNDSVGDSRNGFSFIKAYFGEHCPGRHDQDGFLGLFTGGFTACATGVSAALIFSYLASLIFKPKMKD